LALEPFTLSDDETEEGRSLIGRTAPGVYTLAKLYGPDWVAKDSPTAFGARFKAAATAGWLQGIAVHPEKTGANAIQYVVYGG